MPDCPSCGADLPKTPKDTLIRDLAELVAKLQVPVSLHASVLCEVGPVWDRIHNQVWNFGWTDADKVEERLREILT